MTTPFVIVRGRKMELLVFDYEPGQEPLIHAWLAYWLDHLLWGN